MDLSKCCGEVFYDLTVLANKVLHTIKINFERTGDISDSDLLQLHSVYGDVAEKALLLLENSTFLMLSTDDGKSKIYQVSGSSGTQYTLFPNLNFCECSAYKFSVCKSDPTFLTCKHRLAAQLAEITKKFKEEILTNTNFVETLLSSVIGSCDLIIS